VEGNLRSEDRASRTLFKEEDSMKYRNGAYEAFAKRFERKPDEFSFGTHYNSIGPFKEAENFESFENPFLAIAEAQDILQRIAPMLSGEALRQLQDARPKEVDANAKGTLHKKTFGSVSGLARECFNRIEHARTAIKNSHVKYASTERINAACNQTYKIKNPGRYYRDEWGVRFYISPRKETVVEPTTNTNDWFTKYKVFAPIKHLRLLEKDLWNAQQKLVLDVSPKLDERNNIHVRECEYVELPEVEKQSGYLAYCQTNEHLFKTITKTPHGARRSCETMIRNAVAANLS